MEERETTTAARRSARHWLLVLYRPNIMPVLEIDPETFDGRSRRLCPDGSCIGVIGDDGRCKLCRLPDGEGSPSAEPFSGGNAADEEVAEFAPRDQADTDRLEGLPFDAGRKLCVDGSCIGVIGPDGRCTECRRSAEG